MEEYKAQTNLTCMLAVGTLRPWKSKIHSPVWTSFLKDTDAEIALSVKSGCFKWFGQMCCYIIWHGVGFGGETMPLHNKEILINVQTWKVSFLLGINL